MSADCIEVVPVIVQSDAMPWPERVDRETIADAIQACVQASRFVGCALGDNVYIAGRVALRELCYPGWHAGHLEQWPRAALVKLEASTDAALSEALPRPWCCT